MRAGDNASASTNRTQGSSLWTPTDICQYQAALHHYIPPPHHYKPGLRTDCQEQRALHQIRLLGVILPPAITGLETSSPATGVALSKSNAGGRCRHACSAPTQARPAPYLDLHHRRREPLKPILTWKRAWRGLSLWPMPSFRFRMLGGLSRLRLARRSRRCRQRCHMHLGQQMALWRMAQAHL